jgi:C-terminal processing protease CtpA/Prc
VKGQGQVILLGAVLTALLPMTAPAQIIGVNLVNDQGASAPCTGLGPIGEFCAKQFEAQGFVRTSAVGHTGLRLSEDGVITAIDPKNRDAAAFMAGDRIVSVDDHPVQANPGGAAAQHLFGKRGDKIKVGLVRAGKPVEVTLQRAAVSEPPGPASTSILYSFHDLIDWRGKYIPCIGAGPAGIVAVTYCTSHFKPYGYAPVPDAGDVGVKLNLEKTDAAVIAEVAPDSPAAKANIQVGDVVQTIDGAPVTGSRGEAARQLLFGKIGDRRRITIDRGGRQQTIPLVLAETGEP